MKTRVVIQSRLNSSRLPGKALMSLAGFPVIELVARRASRPLADGSRFEVVVATSDEPYDDLIANCLKNAEIPVFQGNLDDVLGRFVAATADLEADDLVVRLTGDNPVVDADLVAELITAIAEVGAEYGRVDIDVVPEGLGVEVFPVRLLRLAAAQSTDSYDHEHVTPWIRRHTEELLFAPSANPARLEEEVNGYRATIDCLEDFDRVARAFADDPDPVATPWSQVMARLVAQTPQLSLAVDAEPRRSREVLGLNGLTSPREARASARAAVRSGVSHALGRRSDVENWRLATEPAVKQRLRLILLLDEPIDLELAWRRLDRPFVDCVLVPMKSLASWKSVLDAAPGVGEWGVIVEDEEDWRAALAAEIPLLYAESEPSLEIALALTEAPVLVIGPGGVAEAGEVMEHPSFDQVVVDRFGL